MWNDNDKIMVVFDKANGGKTQFPCQCPICQKTLPIFMFIVTMTSIAEFGHGAMNAVRHRI